MKEIRDVVNRYIAAIHTQDPQEFRLLWTGTGTDTLISVATEYRGIDSIVSDFLQGSIRKKYAEITLVPEETPEIRCLDRETALVIFRYHTECIKRDDHTPFGISGVETQVLKCLDGQWKLCHVHYSKK
jgi:hypothetical protein